ncbi:MAG: aldo/keto reductase [Bacillota bacterium]|jgi:predicted aldo/keto reductase-like oxidoreductase|nr:aldo/keto reductase [Bacillota bacterium]NLM07782.1 4Fe-4S binding protein [Clostridiales Family XIII bacterium]
MRKNLLGNTGLMVTEVGFGVLTVGNTQLNLPIPEGAALIRYALERGINFLDTAQYYQTYPYIRQALKGTDFDPVIVSKCLYGGYKDMEEAIEEARKEMDRDVVEVFLLHEVRGEKDWELRAGAWECLQDAKAKGIVKAVGISTHHVDVTRLAAGIPSIDVVFPLINFKGLGIRNGENPGTKEDMAEAIKDAADAGKGVFAMKVFGGGILLKDYRQAVEYVKNLPGISSLMIGFGHPDEVDRIIEMMEGTLSYDYVPDMSNKRIFIDQGDCEGCEACLRRCPNHAIYMNETGQANVNYDICLTCGYCAPVCPVRAIIML